jgi:hypothetical protein
MMQTDEYELLIMLRQVQDLNGRMLADYSTLWDRQRELRAKTGMGMPAVKERRIVSAVAALQKMILKTGESIRRVKHMR